MVSATLPVSLPASRYYLIQKQESAKSFICHTSEFRTAKPFTCHTSQKPVCKSFSCHTFSKFSFPVPFGSGLYRLQALLEACQWIRVCERNSSATLLPRYSRGLLHTAQALLEVEYAFPSRPLAKTRAVPQSARGSLFPKSFIICSYRKTQGGTPSPLISPRAIRLARGTFFPARLGGNPSTQSQFTLSLHGAATLLP